MGSHDAVENFQSLLAEVHILTSGAYIICKWGKEIKSVAVKLANNHGLLELSFCYPWCSDLQKAKMLEHTLAVLANISCSGLY